ncbi:unnamed protein product, partial [marine sediment metagenome]
FDVNGEAIYGTTAWVTHGEGPTEMKESGVIKITLEEMYW